MSFKGRLRSQTLAISSCLALARLKLACRICHVELVVCLAVVSVALVGRGALEILAVGIALEFAFSSGWIFGVIGVA